MSEAIGKLENLIIQSQSPTPEAKVPRAFELNRPYFDIGFPVTWPPLGEINVKHRMRRPKPGEESDYKKKCVTEQRIIGGGKITDEKVKVGGARIWLWDQISVAVKDYPGMGEDWVELTPELRAQTRGAHKESAIRWLFECDVDVLENESVMTLTEANGLSCCASVCATPITPRSSCGSPSGLKNRRTFSRARIRSAVRKFKGKTKLSTSSVNQRAYRDLFAGTLVNVEADPAAGLHDLITVDGEPFSTMNKAKFADAFLGEWQVNIMAALVQLWWGK